MEPPIVDPGSLRKHAGYDNYTYDNSDAATLRNTVAHQRDGQSVPENLPSDTSSVQNNLDSVDSSAHKDLTGNSFAVALTKNDKDTHKDKVKETEQSSACADVIIGAETAKYSSRKDGDHDPGTEKEAHGPAWIIFIVETKISSFLHSHRRIIRIIIYLLLFAAYNAFLIYACVRDFTKAKKLFILTMVVYVCVIYFKFVSKPFWSKAALLTKPLRKYLRQHRTKRRRIQVILFFCAVIIFLGIDCANQPRRLQSLTGIFGIILFGLLISKYPARVNWYIVVWGIAVQLVSGLIVLRWDAGRSVFTWMGDIIETLITFTDAGSEFVFGANYKEHFFAFAICPVIVFFGFLIAALYYLGVMQWVIMKIGWLLYVVLGTTACESFASAANIFVGMTEAPLMIRPYLEVMTKSELHALFVGGFANVAGSVLAAYISFGVSAVHLLSASIMSAPCSLALAKLVYPETEISKTGFEQITMDRGAEQNILEAATVGAQQTIKLISYMVANLISCLAALKMFNFLLEYLGGLVGVHGLTFEFLCGYLFVPLAWSMGCDWQDVTEVGSLVGTKTILNEFIAYTKLGELIKNRTITERSELVATYALCGFSNITSLGITIGGMAAIAPGRRTDIINVGFRSLITGCLSCFMCASIASLLVDT